jgi:uncharacterized protein (DUF983 family)
MKESKAIFGMCPECFSLKIKTDVLKKIIKCKSCGKRFFYKECSCHGEETYVIEEMPKY